MCPCPPAVAALTVNIDPRQLDQVVDMTREVAEVAATLVNLGMTQESARLLAALDHLDADPV